MSARQDTELMVNALQMSVPTRRLAQVIHHSNHGSQYASLMF